MGVKMNDKVIKEVKDILWEIYLFEMEKRGIPRNIIEGCLPLSKVTRVIISFKE